MDVASLVEFLENLTPLELNLVLFLLSKTERIAVMVVVTSMSCALVASS